MITGVFIAESVGKDQTPSHFSLIFVNTVRFSFDDYGHMIPTNCFLLQYVNITALVI